EGVGRRGGEVAVDVRGLVVLAAAVVGQGDPTLLELLVHARELVVVQLERLEELAEGGEVAAAFLLPAFDQRLELVLRHTGPVPRITAAHTSGRCSATGRSRDRSAARARRPRSARDATNGRPFP